jgi:hypothetical protein
MPIIEVANGVTYTRKLSEKSARAHRYWKRIVDTGGVPKVPANVKEMLMPFVGTWILLEQSIFVRVVEVHDRYMKVESASIGGSTTFPYGDYFRVYVPARKPAEGF